MSRCTRGSRHPGEHDLGELRWFLEEGLVATPLEQVQRRVWYFLDDLVPHRKGNRIIISSVCEQDWHAQRLGSCEDVPLSRR